MNLLFSKDSNEPFIGREKELKSLEGFFAPILENQGCFVLIEGETGIGKTRLVERFLETTKPQGATVILGHGYHKEISPYRLFSEMLRNYFSSIDYDTRYLAPLLDNLTIALLEKIIPEIKPYIPFDVSRITVPPLSPKEEKQRFYDLLLLFFLKLSHRSPLILTIEDLHWLEPDTLELLRYLITNVRKSPILVVATSRGSEPGSFTEKWLAGLEDQRFVHRLKLSGLAAEEVGKLTGFFFNAELTDRFFRWLVGYTAGNPLLLNETLRAGMEQNVYFFDPVESRWEIKDEYLEGILEPATIQSVIDRRLEGLDRKSQSVLSLTAVMGDRFDLETLQRISTISPVELRRIVGDLMVKDLLHRISDSPAEKGSYRFAHHVVRIHIYQRLSLEFRQRTHLQIASVLEKHGGKLKSSQMVEDLAYHFSRGRKDRNSTKKSVDYLILAGQRMQRNYSERKAEQYFIQALELLKSLPDSKPKFTRLLTVRECLGEVESRVGKSDSAIRSYQEALRLGETHQLLDRLKEAQMYRKIGYAFHAVADYSSAISYYQRALERLKEVSSGPERAEYVTICNSMGLTHVTQGEKQECIDWSEKAIRLCQRRRLILQMEQSYSNLGMAAYGQGKYEKAIEYFNRGLEIQQKIQDKSRLSALNINLGVIHLHLAQYEKAEEHYQKGLNLAQEMGNLGWKAIIYNNLGVMYKDRGEWERALGFLEKSLKIRELYGDRRGMVSSFDNLAVTFFSQGQLDKASEYAHKSLNICQEIGAKDVLPVIKSDLGEICFHLNDHQRGFALLEEALDLATKQSSRLTIGIARRTLGRFHLSLGKWEDAERQLEESKAIFEDLGSTFHLAQTLESLGICLAQRALTQPPEQRETLLKRSLDALYQAVEILGRLNFEKRLILLKDRIRESGLGSEWNSIIQEIDKRAGTIRTESQSGVRQKSQAPVQISGDYIDHLRIYCFGRLRVYRPYESDEIPSKEWGSVKARQILAYLAVKDTKRIGVTKDKLVDAIWPETDPQSLGNTFHVTLSYLRKAIEKEKNQYLTSQAGVYRLDWEGKVWSDVGEFLTCLDSASVLQKEQKLHLMDSAHQRAAELYSSNLLEDFYERWAEEARDEYREKYNVLFWKLAQSSWEKCDYEKCIRHLQSLLLSDPTNEEAHRLIMLSYALLGSRTAAIRQFKVCEDNLKRYLEIEPEPETLDLHKKIKHGNPKDYRKLLSLAE
ncbi:MAG: tetratricopeptide repeat protein [Candidatus Zixiibacteriota bacterium]